MFADWIQTTMNTLGYLGIAILMFTESVFPPIPSEVIMPLAGFTAVRGQLSLLGVIIAGTIGSVLGALPYYYLGHFVGTERMVEWADKYGKWLTLSGKEIKRADAWFDKHGHKVVFFCRFIPGVRSLISIPAGVSGMRMLPFLLYTLAGSAIWAAALALLGYFLGRNYHLVDTYLGPVSLVLLVVLVLAFIVWLLMRKRRQSQLSS